MARVPVLSMSDTAQPRGTPIRSMSALLPAYNEAAHLVHVVEATLDALHDAVPDFEVIIVDDGSTDITASLCAEISAKYPAVRVVRHDRTLGYGAAVRSGIAAAGKQFLFIMPANRRYDPADVGRLAQWGDRYDLVRGYRPRRQDPLYRALLGKFFTVLARLLLSLQTRDVACDFQLLRATLLKEMDLQSSTTVLNAEILYYARQQQASMHAAGVHHYPRRTTRGAVFRLRTLIRTIEELVTLRRRIGRERRTAAAATPPPGA